jgi:hypothetical protein
MVAAAAKRSRAPTRWPRSSTSESRLTSSTPSGDHGPDLGAFLCHRRRRFRHIAVKVSGVKAPRTPPTPTLGLHRCTFTAVGLRLRCDMIKNAAANMVTIIFGRKDIIPT